MSWSEPAWDALAAELYAWAEAGRVATFWWRDDDAGPDRPALRRLLGVAAASGVPLGLAVVPAWLTDETGSLLATAAPGVRVLQHGWAHVNHEPAGPPGADGRPTKGKPGECGVARPTPAVLAEIAAGQARLAGLRSRRCPAFVPPWNRIADPVAAGLPALGFRALSTFGPRPAPEAVPGLAVVNAHLDLVVWREGKRFLGAGPSLARLKTHLEARRTGAADAAEPTGLLTHHAAMDEAGWRFLATLLERLPAHPAVTWPPVDHLLG